MSNLIDYVIWRGDLTFSDNRFNAVDNFILSMITYIDYDKVFINYNPRVKFSMAVAAKEFCKTTSDKDVHLGVLMPSQNIRKIFELMGRSKRFSTVEVSDFVNEVDYKSEMQFCAVTYHLTDSEMFVCFRGTDDTLVGWKEDCKLSYLNKIPAQERSVEYLENIARKYPDKRMYVGGHSKGGNLAKYSSIYCDDEIKDRIVFIFNNDGPGFRSGVIDEKKLSLVESKIRNYIPPSSLFGQMFESHGTTTIIKSSKKGLYQHDCFSWQVRGAGVVSLKNLSTMGEKHNQIFESRIMSVPIEKRSEVVDMFFSIIDQTGAKTLLDFTEDKFTKAAMAVKGVRQLDKEQRALMGMLLTQLLDIKVKTT